MAKKKSAARKSAAKKNTNTANQGRAGASQFPKHSVVRALRIPRAILEQNAGKPSTPEEAASFVKVTNSGPFRSELASAIKYGWLERVDGKLQPTELAKDAIRPKAEGDQRRAYRAAILNAPQIADVYRHYRGENLPEDNFLRNTVVDVYKVPGDSFDEFRTILLESLEAAELLEKHGDKTRVLDATEGAGRGSSEEQSALTKKLAREVSVQSTDTCFVMQPFAAPLGTYYEKVYKPAIEKAGLTAIRADAEIFGTGKIIDQVWRGISSAKVLVAELTSRNPNVLYELGLAHALKKPVVLISDNEDDVPFDLHHIRVIYYDKSDPFWGQKLLDKVTENILSAIKNPEEAIFKGATD